MTSPSKPPENRSGNVSDDTLPAHHNEPEAVDPRTHSPLSSAEAAAGTSLWGGRFVESTDEFVQSFTASVDFDHRLYRQDIQGSRAHATMLHRCGVLDERDIEQILSGLDRVEQSIEAGQFEWSVELEDVHMNIEAALTRDIGDAGKRLHTGRSRNDQVATDMRLYLRDACDSAAGQFHHLLNGLLKLAAEHTDTIMPGFTHLQSAQPVTFGHHVLAWFEMLLRDLERLHDTRRRINRMPLGAAALAGTSYPIRREVTAELLGFDALCENSLDAVSDRDFAIEFCSTTSITLMHLSRMAEELILWMSAQFRFIDLPDRYCTGSSIMPQKKNPDVPELVRGKSGRCFGNLMSLLTLMKSQPLAYNKDNQEDKEPLFDSVDTLHGCLRAFGDMLPQIVVNKRQMYHAARSGYSTATDLADYLVRKGLAFRDAHEVVGKAVAFGIETNADLSELSLEQLRSFSDRIDQDVFDVLTLEGSVASRQHIGGTAPAAVSAAIDRAAERLSSQIELFDHPA